MADQTPKTPSIADLMSLVTTLAAQVAELQAERKEPVYVAQDSSEFVRKPWEERILVEALADCTYPDPNDAYPKYRYGRSEGQPGSTFLLMHREHLNKFLREIGKDEVVPDRAVPTIPQTGARGQRVRPQMA